MSENPTNRERSRHVSLRSFLAGHGAVKLIKCARTHHVADALSKSLPKPALQKHREFLHGTAQSLSAFFAIARVSSVVAYVSRLTKTGNVFLSRAFDRCIGG